MGGFPALPSGNNPYIGAASGYASAAASLATSLRAAATQQQALKQAADEKAAAQKHQDASDLATALEHGAIAVTGGAPDLATNPATGRPTLAQSDETTSQSPGYGAQAAQDPDYSFDPRRIVNRGGTAVYYPTEEEKAAVAAKAKKANETLDDTNSFPLSNTGAQAMNEAGYADLKPGDRIPMAHAGTVTAAVKEHLNKSALDDTNSVQVTQDMADRLAPHGITLKPGARVSLEKAADLKALVEMAEPKDSAEKSLHWERNENDAGDVTLRGLDPITGKEVQKFNYPGEGRKKKDPDAESAQKPPSPAQFRQIEATKQQSMKQAAAGLKKDLSEALSDDDKKTANENYRGALSAAQNAYEAEIGALTGKDVAHNPWADAATKPQTNQPTNDAPKSATTQVSGTAKTQLSTGHKVGDSVQLKTGKTVKISKINPDGSFEGQ